MTRLSSVVPDVYRAHIGGTSANPVIRVRGCLDSGTFVQLLQLTQSIDLQEAQSLVVDLHGVTFIDAAGLRSLMTLRQRTVASGCRLLLSRPSQPVRKLLRLCGLDRSFEFEPEGAGQPRHMRSAA